MKYYNLFVIYAVLICIFVVACNWNGGRTIEQETAMFVVSDTALITSVALKKNNSEILLNRYPEGWTVNGKPAKNSSVNYLLRTMKRLKLKSPIPSAQKDSTLQSLKEHGVEVCIFSEKNLILKFLVSSPPVGSEGATFKLHDSSEPYNLYLPAFAADLFPLFQTELNYWRDNTIFKYFPSAISEIEVIHNSYKEYSFRLSINDSTNMLYLGKEGKFVKPSNEAVRQYLTYFWSVKYDYVASGMSKVESDSILNITPLQTIKVKNMQGEEVCLSIIEMKDKITGKTDLNKHYAKIKGRSDLLIMRYVVSDALTKKSDYFSVIDSEQR